VIGLPTCGGEKHDRGEVFRGGEFGAKDLLREFGERTMGDGHWKVNSAVVDGFGLTGSEALLAKSGFGTSKGRFQVGAGAVDLNDDVREGGSLGTNVAGVPGREASLTIEDRFDETVDASDGQMIGEGASSEGSSMVAMCMALGGSVVLLLKSGFGINSVSSWNMSFGNGGRSLS
jgi:hypothetical protein